MNNTNLSASNCKQQEVTYIVSENNQNKKAAMSMIMVVSAELANNLVMHEEE